MLAEYYPSSRDYYIYLEDVDIEILLVGTTLEADLVILPEKDIRKSHICVKVAPIVKGEASRNVQWDVNPTTFTFGMEHFRSVIMNDDIHLRTSGYTETRYSASGDKIHVFRGTEFHAEQFKEMATFRLTNFDLYEKRYAELREKDEGSE